MLLIVDYLFDHVAFCDNGCRVVVADEARRPKSSKRTSVEPQLPGCFRDINDPNASTTIPVAGHPTPLFSDTFGCRRFSATVLIRIFGQKFCEHGESVVKTTRKVLWSIKVVRDVSSRILEFRKNIRAWLVATTKRQTRLSATIRDTSQIRRIYATNRRHVAHKSQIVALSLV